MTDMKVVVRKLVPPVHTVLRYKQVPVAFDPNAPIDPAEETVTQEHLQVEVVRDNEDRWLYAIDPVEHTVFVDKAEGLRAVCAHLDLPFKAPPGELWMTITIVDDRGERRSTSHTLSAYALMSAGALRMGEHVMGVVYRRLQHLLATFERFER